ncbi:UNVERIFIED_CONTAM: hypothetical protein GTU68_005318 [Idotea baltica]|nr:hypothetical protein [Idotea baltica]
MANSTVTLFKLSSNAKSPQASLASSPSEPPESLPLSTPTNTSPSSRPPSSSPTEISRSLQAAERTPLAKRFTLPRPPKRWAQTHPCKSALTTTSPTRKVSTSTTRRSPKTPACPSCFILFRGAQSSR